MAEIGTRTIFENFSYRFGEKIYRQSSGGPIGARVTMCAARLVMQDFGEKYKASLTLARMELTLLSGYVDDVRQGGTSLGLGMKYSIENDKWEWSEKAMWEDVERRKGGENRDERMRRICLPLLNTINKDLEFTA